MYNLCIRVLQVIDKISVDSGVSSIVMNYYARFEHDKINFDFMLNEDVSAGTRDYIESNGSRIYVMPNLKTVNVFRYIKSLTQFYKKHEYRIIHGHVVNSAVFYLGLARKKAPIRIIHSHSTKLADIWWKRIRNRFLTRFIKLVANRFIACSNEAAQFLYGKSNDATIINNAIDVDKFMFSADKRKSIRRELALEDKIVIGHVGRFIPLKNHGFLLDVFCEIRKTHGNTILILFGSGELFDKMKQKALGFGINEAVIFMGTKDNISDYYSAMDVFVLPSLFEGLPVTGVEAQANGLPCVFSDTVTREAQIIGNCSFLPTNDPVIWAENIMRLSKKTRNCVDKSQMSEYDVDVQAERLAKYYDILWKIQQ